MAAKRKEVILNRSQLSRVTDRYISKKMKHWSLSVI